MAFEGLPIIVTGRNADVDTGTEEINAVVRGTLPAVEYVASAVSSDAADDGSPVGTGAQTLLIRGIQKTTYAEVEETITLNGIGAVTTTTKFIRINEAKVIAVGSGGVNAGTITVSLNAQAQVTIPIGYGHGNGLYYAVPADHYASIYHMLITPGELATTEVVRYQLQARDISTLASPGPWHVLMEGDLFWSPIDPEPQDHLHIPEKSEFRVVAVSAVNNKIVSGNVIFYKMFGEPPLNIFR